MSREGEPAGARVALRLTEITKEFPGVRALNKVSFGVCAGEVHGLVGENGAGKSTLVGVAAGLLAPDSGYLEIDGTVIPRLSVKAARAMGIAIVRQTPALLPDLTVTENLWLCVRGVWGDGRLLAPDRRWSEELLAAWGQTAIDPRARVSELTADQRAIVEISGALAPNPSVLILDEPTEHLTEEDVARLFQKVREQATQGAAVVYISHRIREVKDLADRVTVLRDGAVHGTFARDNVSEREIINLIVGRSIEAAFPQKYGEEALDDRVVLKVEGFRGPSFDTVDISTRPGEILGLAGIEGHGQREFLRALAGLVPSSGLVEVDSTRVPVHRPGSSWAAGMVYIPNDRHSEGLFPQLSVRENIAFSTLAANAHVGFVNSSEETSSVMSIAQRLRIKATSLEAPIESLSGGNQQKVVLARVLALKPKVILADEPTQGVDVGSRIEIYRILREFTKDGGAVVVVSTDGLELEGLCDRVVIFSRGQVIRELVGDRVTERNITEAAVTSSALRSGSSRGGWTSLPFLKSDIAPAAAIAIVALLLGLYAGKRNSFFLTGLNFKGMLLLFATLAFVALGQQVVIMIGGIDLSVGPLMGFCVIIASFFISETSSPGAKLLGLALIFLFAVVVGLINWTLADVAGLHPVIATLVTFMTLQGLALILRPVPGGTIDPAAAHRITAQVGFVPVAAILVVIAAALLENVSRRTAWGASLRAAGSDPGAAATRGIRLHMVRMSAYVACSLLSACAGVLLVAQVGSGLAGAGTGYTISSIAAVVLGGTSIVGGRGTFIGTVAAAFLLQELINVTVFLGLSAAWHQYMLGAVLLIAVAGYSRILEGKRFT